MRHGYPKYDGGADDDATKGVYPRPALERSIKTATDFQEYEP